MLLKNRLFTPGPTPLLPAAQTAMASFSLHHRTADFRALFTRVLSDMKEFIGTQNDVLVLACSGTGVMEGSVSNLTSPGDKVLVLTAGKFGERWRDLGKAFGCAVETVSAPYGETFSLDEVKKKLTPDVRAVYMQATESSTGARHDVKGVAKLVQRHGRHSAGGRCHHWSRHHALRRGRLGNRRHHRRLAKGADDSARPGLLRHQRARLEAHGDGEISALLFRFPQGAQVRGERRISLHARHFAVCRAGRSFGVHPPDGQRRPGGRPRGSGQQRRISRGDDPRRGSSAGIEAFCRIRPGSRAHGDKSLRLESIPAPW